MKITPSVTYLNALLCEYAEYLLEVDVKAVEEGALRRQVLHNQGRTTQKIIV
jgi:hypothetical protein